MLSPELLRIAIILRNQQPKSLPFQLQQMPKPHQYLGSAHDGMVWLHGKSGETCEMKIASAQPKSQRRSALEPGVSHEDN